MPEHGTRARYCRGCKCAPCTEANRAYARMRYRQLHHPYAWGEADQLVDATEVRRHLRYLRRNGVGLRVVAARTGYSRSLLQRVLGGSATTTPIARIRRSHAERILSVGLSEQAPSALVDATRAWALIDQLLAAGYSKVWVARHVHGPHALSLQLGRSRITRVNDDAVEQLYEKTWHLDARLRALADVA